MKRQLLAKILCRSGLRLILDKVARWSGVLVLNYHRVGNGKLSVFDRALWSASSEAFDDQIQYCKKQFDVVGPEDLSSIICRGKGRHVLITFDDGYRDNYETAFPILKNRGVKGLFFICTGFIDEMTLPWWDEIAWMVRTSEKRDISLPTWMPDPVKFDAPDREQAIRKLLKIFKGVPSEITGSYLDDLGKATGAGRYDKSDKMPLSMTWDMIREMRSSGMSIGGHTVTHPILGQASRDQQWREIAHCGQRIESELGETMRYFSYPDGTLQAFNSDTRDCLDQAGVHFAFSYYDGYRSYREWDKYDIRRIAIEEHVTFDLFRAILSLPSVFARPRLSEGEHLAFGKVSGDVASHAVPSTSQ